uniref:Uncharacterized protein n=1 Tax=Oryza brachyantha TaxID=4533 RepID=J3NER3_ORYBR
MSIYLLPQLKVLPFVMLNYAQTYFPLEIMSPYNHGSFESFQGAACPSLKTICAAFTKK